MTQLIIRIRYDKDQEGFIVEHKRSPWGLFWRPLVTWSGLDQAYPFESKDRALRSLASQIEEKRGPVWIDPTFKGDF